MTKELKRVEGLGGEGMHINGRWILNAVERASRADVHVWGVQMPSQSVDVYNRYTYSRCQLTTSLMNWKRHDMLFAL